MLIKIAITGGLSCGKSSVCRILSELGAHVVSADDIVHQILRSPNTNIGKKVVALLGPDIIENNTIDRSLVAKKVFNNPLLLSSLEKILHPAVFEEVERQYQEQNEQIKKFQTSKIGIKPSLFVAEIPLLFEVSGEKYFDYTLAVISREEECKKRFSLSKGLTEKEFDERMARQLPQKEKARLSDFVIENNGSQDDLKSAVTIFYKNFLNPN